MLGLKRPVETLETHVCVKKKDGASTEEVPHPKSPSQGGGEDAGKRAGAARVALDRQKKAAYSRACSLVWSFSEPQFLLSLGNAPSALSFSQARKKC